MARDSSCEESNLETNLEAIVRLEKESREHRTRAERLSDAVAQFAGSQKFILLHIVWFTLWIVLNINLIPALKPFDKYPFNFLTMVVSLEAILLTAFVMISQNRMSRQAEKREHLDLQVNLLAEEELTKALQMLQKICASLGIRQDDDDDVQRLATKTDLESIANAIDRKLAE